MHTEPLYLEYEHVIRKKVLFNTCSLLSRVNPGNCGIFCLLSTAEIFIFGINGFGHA